MADLGGPDGDRRTSPPPGGAPEQDSAERETRLGEARTERDRAAHRAHEAEARLNEPGGRNRTMAHYWTRDLSEADPGKMAETAFLLACETEEEARMLAEGAARQKNEPGNDERIEVVHLGHRDCWSKVPRSWSGEEIRDHCEQLGLREGDYEIRGDHPGPQDELWISVTAPVLGAKIVQAEHARGQQEPRRDQPDPPREQADLPRELTAVLRCCEEDEHGEPVMLSQQVTVEYRPDADGRPGEGLVVRRDERDAVCGIDDQQALSRLDLHILLRGPAGAEQIEVDPLTISGWETLRAVAQEDGNPDSGSASAWVAMLNILHGDIDRRLDPASGRPVAPSLASVALGRRISERILLRETDVPPGVDHDALCRYAVSLEQRRRIDQLTGAAASRRRTLPSLIRQDRRERFSGVQFFSGARFRAPALAAASAHGHPRQRQQARQTDALVRRVFAPLTSLPPEEMTVGMMPRSEVGRIREMLAHADQAELKDPARCPWLAAVRDEIRIALMDCFDRTYEPELDFYEVAGHDVLLVADHAGGYIYSWPSTERQLLFERDGRPAVALVDPGRCPSSEELEAERRQLEQLMSERVLGHNLMTLPEAAATAGGPEADGQFEPG